MKRLGVLLSGRGSNFEAIARQIENGQLEAEIAVVISNLADAPGLATARAMGLTALWVSGKGLSQDQYDQRLIEVLQEHQVDLVCLAGFMRLLGPVMVQAFPERILNIHPSLLPSFPGLHAQRQALEHGVKFAGCTVHFVDEGVDSGPIIRQAAVPVRDHDTEATLSARILQQEHRIYAEAIALVLNEEYRIENRRVIG
ncbi:MAG: phosphoribosylglycinamide formyltransferase [Acidobacteria bacterium]|nr:phosphoribosylglycinamide formyltransferase [Acidobacteriota bacterium]